MPPILAVPSLEEKLFWYKSLSLFAVDWVLQVFSLPSPLGPTNFFFFVSVCPNEALSTLPLEFSDSATVFQPPPNCLSTLFPTFYSFPFTSVKFLRVTPFYLFCSLALSG